MRAHIFVFVIALMLLSAFSASAHPGRPDHVYTDPDLPEACIQVYDPVHDARGNTYGNRCLAAQQGVRAVWQGTAH